MFETPGDRVFYHGDVDLLDSLGLLVRIDAGVNQLTGLRLEPLPPPQRNQPCPCGSGKKYKQCHGKLT